MISGTLNKTDKNSTIEFGCLIRIDKQVEHGHCAQINSRKTGCLFSGVAAIHSSSGCSFFINAVAL